MKKVHSGNNGDRFVALNRNQTKSKYGNNKIIYEGMKFDSQAELRRYKELKLLERAGQIKGLERQVKYVLIPSQKDNDGKIIERECSYVADFVYLQLVEKHTKFFCAPKNLPLESDHLYEKIVEDVKGFKTRDYLIKRKLMLRVHLIRIHEVN